MISAKYKEILEQQMQLQKNINYLRSELIRHNNNIMNKNDLSRELLDSVQVVDSSPHYFLNNQSAGVLINTPYKRYPIDDKLRNNNNYTYRHF
ncbi:hypothetical protein AYR72_gp081 [Cnaphalocrocis medinalis granulovirus]|uniref:ORF89 n=1 Tax=Cnaphalocrocis medinalis granulovirus TaxID=1750712 RepID=A0A0X9FH76_9BBAC|nr:hypothetical protein AYR72_gp081 [Cnaphalocrocis medinalis granulovirus]ALN42022.1 ORF89 [Cnaphalocrocis medinalis granulovirus]AMF83833.1 hypothetical protein [Cnaphalocrocis medinalis granulovirus]WPN08711.1 hypothetical protein [Cnaphalocrocis medinalis granulovirus]